MSHLNTGDTAFLLISAALVMLMTPALGLFYGGMVRRKNVLGTIMHSFFVLGLVSVLWALIGYTLAFGPGGNAFIGGLKWLGLNGVGQAPNADYAGTVPHLAFMVFQLMFAVITPALITGAFAERMKFSAFVSFIIFWSLFVYSPICHWVWGTNGWIRALGVLDFAGGTVVHISSGAAALAAAIVIGHRYRHSLEPMSPHNIPLTILGAALLWFGWFGFNAGSALTSAGLATSAFVATHLSAAAATHLLGAGRVEASRQADDPGSGLRVRDRPGGDHAGLRIRRADGGAGDRVCGRSGLLHGGTGQAALQL